MRYHRYHSFFLFPLAFLCVDSGSFPAPFVREANASVAIAATLDDLARASSVIARVTPLERTTAWEDGRIVTTTRVRVEDIVAGATPHDNRELQVRTLGGRVGDVGQLVEGEASFSAEGPSIVFLTPHVRLVSQSAFVVVGRAQGQLLVKRNAQNQEIVRVGAVGALVERLVHPPLRAGGRRITELDGSALQALAIEAKRAWEVGHAK